MEAVPYHRLAHERRWRALAEIPLSLLFMFGGATVVAVVAFAIAGVKKLKDLDELSSLAITLGGLALLVPACRVAARALGRKPATLSSVAGHMRWRWLLRCVGFAVLLELVLLVPVIGLITSGSSDKLTWTGWSRFAPAAAIIVALVPLQAAGDEHFFRGTLVQSVGAWWPWPWLAIAVSGAAFSAIHLAPWPASVALFGIGATAAWLTIRTGGIEAAIAVHVVGNLGVLLLHAATSTSTSASKINEGVSWTGTAIQLLLQLLFAALVARSYRRRPPS